MQWYEKEKDNLVPNLRYPGNDESFPLELFRTNIPNNTRHMRVSDSCCLKEEGVKGSGTITDAGNGAAVKDARSFNIISTWRIGR